jgi:hypothetical protein
MQRLEPLNIRQADMLARSRPRAKRGDPMKRVALLEYRTKITAFAFLTQRWSVARIAIQLGINTPALQAWVDRGCPLLEEKNQVALNQTDTHEAQ